MKKLFTNDKFFGAVTILAILCTVFNAAVFLVETPDTRIFSVADLVGALCVAVLFISYKNHSKNVMKGMMGALLMQMFMMSLFCINDHSGEFDMIMAIIILVIVTALLTNHFVINSDRKASPFAIRLNRVLCVLYALAMIADTVYFIAVDEMLLEKLGDAFFVVASICVAASIVCVESRLDAYRLDREAAGWTEEAGYPEGYVHQYEKE